MYVDNDGPNLDIVDVVDFFCLVFYVLYDDNEDWMR